MSAGNWPGSFCGARTDAAGRFRAGCCHARELGRRSSKCAESSKVASIVRRPRRLRSRRCRRPCHPMRRWWSSSPIGRSIRSPSSATRGSVPRAMWRLCLEQPAPQSRSTSAMPRRSTRGVDRLRRALRNPKDARVARVAREVDAQLMAPVRARLGARTHVFLLPTPRSTSCRLPRWSTSSNAISSTASRSPTLRAAATSFSSRCRPPYASQPLIVANPQFDRPGECHERGGQRRPRSRPQPRPLRAISRDSRRGGSHRPSSSGRPGADGLPGDRARAQERARPPNPARGHARVLPRRDGSGVR